MVDHLPNPRLSDALRIVEHATRATRNAELDVLPAVELAKLERRGVISASTPRYVIHNSYDEISSKVAAHFWSQSEEYQDAVYALSHMDR